MAIFNVGYVVPDNIAAYDLRFEQGWMYPSRLESFSYVYDKPLDNGRQMYGAMKPAMVDFSVRLQKDRLFALFMYNAMYKNELMTFSFLFDAKKDYITNEKFDYYAYGVVASGYVVSVEEEFHSAKDSRGCENQTILHVKLLLRDIYNLSKTWLQKDVQTAFFLSNKRHGVRTLSEHDTRLRLNLRKSNKGIELACVTESMVAIFMGYQEKRYLCSLQSLSVTKAMNKPNEVKARLFLLPIVGRTDMMGKEDLGYFINSRVTLTVNETYTVFDDYFVQDAIPTFSDDGKLYLDLIIYSPDYLLTTQKNCRTFVGMKLTDIFIDLLDHVTLPYMDNMTLPYGENVGGNLLNIVHDGQEHIFPYLVQYNESTYDFLRRTLNRWGEFLFYDNGKLKMGYDSSIYSTVATFSASVQGREEKDYITYCPSISSCYDPAAAKPSIVEMRHHNPEVAQEFLDNVLAKDMYEQPAWVRDNLIADLTAYGQAKRYTEALKVQFNQDYFDAPKDGIPQLYAEQYDRQNEDMPLYSEFTEAGHPFFKAYDKERYKKVLPFELSRDRYTVLLDFDTQYYDLSLGNLIKIGEEGKDYYVVSEISITCEDARPHFQVKAIKASGLREDNTIRAICFPPYIASGHTRKAGMQKAVVVDADDPLRRNRVRVKFDWQGGMEDPSPWLMMSQDGATPGAGSHVRHYPGEQVLVDYIGGNVERPYVVGAIPDNVPEKDNWDSPAGVVFKTPRGHSFRMSDGTGAGLQTFNSAMEPKLRLLRQLIPASDNELTTISYENPSEDAHFEGNVEIKDHYNIYNVKCSTNDRQVSFSSPWGNVLINAFTGITITAPNGNIRIAGKNVTVEAGNNLKLVSGTNIRNKFLPEGGGTASSSISVAREAAAKALLAFDEKGPIDLALLRHVRDKVVKPVEGVLEVQSNRYLKLSSGGASVGYPGNKYNAMKLFFDGKILEHDWYDMGDAVAKLINEAWAIFTKEYQKFCVQFNVASECNATFENKVLELKEWSEVDDDPTNLDATKVCNLYADLKDTLSSKDKLEEADLGFVDQYVSVADDASTEKSEQRKDKKHKEVMTSRKNARLYVVAYANSMLKAVKDLKKCKFESTGISDRKYLVGNDVEKYLPEKYMELVEQALSAEKCSVSTLYQSLTKLDDLDLTSDTWQNLANVRHPDTAEKMNALKHLVALNLLEGIGFKAKKNGQTVTLSSLVTSEADLTGTQWNTTTDYIVYEYDTSDSQKAFRKRKVKEKNVWSDAKKGQILMVSGRPYALGKEMKPVGGLMRGLRTGPLVKQLSEPIMKALGVSVIDNVAADKASDMSETIDMQFSLARQQYIPKVTETFKYEEEEEKQEDQQEKKAVQEEKAEKKEVKQQQVEEKAPESYYQCGDVICYDKDYYICVSKHKYNETARFISLNNQKALKNTLVTRYHWTKAGNDTVYSCAMASAETMYDWIANVLLDDNIEMHLQTEVLPLSNTINMRALYPENENIRKELLKEMVSMRQFVTNAYKPMKNFISDENPDKQIMPIKNFVWKSLPTKESFAYIDGVAPTSFLLVGQAGTDINGKESVCVPYVLLVRDKQYEEVKTWLNADSSQNGSEYFKWEDLGTVKYEGKLTFDGSTETLHVLKLACCWTHEDITDPNDEKKTFRASQDWTKHWAVYKDKPQLVAKYRATPQTWITQNITSKELTFIDDGTKKEDYTSTWVKKEKNPNPPDDGIAFDKEELDAGFGLEGQDMDLPDMVNDDEIVNDHDGDDDAEQAAQDKDIVDAIGDQKEGGNQDGDGNNENKADSQDKAEGGNAVIVADANKEGEKKEDEEEKKDEEQKEEDKQEEEAADDRCYYQVGDIIIYEDRYWVCVSKHKYGENARFITLNDQTEHKKKTFPWKEENNSDVVYSDDMASAETMTDWITNILLDDNMCESVSYGMTGALPGEDATWVKANIRQIMPESQAVREALVSFLFNTANAMGSIFKSVPDGSGVLTTRISGFYWDEIQRSTYKLQFHSIVGYLLVDKLVYTRYLRYKTDHWVPYVLCIKEGKDWDVLSKYFDQEDTSQGLKSPNDFKWQDMGRFVMKSDQLSKVVKKNKAFHIVKLAVYWDHKQTAEFGKVISIILDFTKDLKNHPDQTTAEHNKRLKGDWVTSCITSREVKYKDKGKTCSKFKDVIVKNRAKKKNKKK